MRKKNVIEIKNSTIAMKLNFKKTRKVHKCHDQYAKISDPHNIIRLCKDSWSEDFFCCPYCHHDLEEVSQVFLFYLNYNFTESYPGLECKSCNIFLEHPEENFKSFNKDFDYILITLPNACSDKEYIVSKKGTLIERNITMPAVPMGNQWTTTKYTRTVPSEINQEEVLADTPPQKLDAKVEDLPYIIHRCKSVEFVLEAINRFHFKHMFGLPTHIVVDGETFYNLKKANFIKLRKDLTFLIDPTQKEFATCCLKGE